MIIIYLLKIPCLLTLHFPLGAFLGINFLSSFYDCDVQESDNLSLMNITIFLVLPHQMNYFMAVNNFLILISNFTIYLDFYV